MTLIVLERPLADAYKKKKTRILLAEKSNVCNRRVIQIKLSLVKKCVTHAGQGREIFISYANVKEKQRGVTEVE